MDKKNPEDKQRIRFQVQKMSDEGTSEPYCARLFMEILDLRNDVLGGNTQFGELRESQKAFDLLYQPVKRSMDNMRIAVKNITKLLEGHQSRILDGSVVKYEGPTVQISESVDLHLQEAVMSFFSSGRTTIDDVQKMVKFFNIDIGCLSKNEGDFEKGLSRLENEGHTPLALFLSEVRTKWSDAFIKQRISIIHDGWCLPPVRYKILATKKVQMTEPQIDDIDLSKYVINIQNRILSFIENVIVYSIKYALPWPMAIAEIPRAERDPDFPKRFLITHAQSTWCSLWEIYYSEDDFP